MRVITIVVFLLCCNNSFSQDLSGRWQGNDKFGEVVIPFFPMFAEFTLNADSSYTVQTSDKEKYINDRDTVAVFHTRYKRKNKNTIIIEEYALASPDTLKKICYTRYNLKIRQTKGKITLEGTYSSTNCSSYAHIVFVKLE